MAAVAEIMDDDNKSTFEMLSGTQKSAILMMLIRRMRPLKLSVTSRQKRCSIWERPCTPQGLDQETVNAVLDEFLAIIKAQPALGWEQVTISAM